MKTALIGYTGFVGGNLDAQHAFTHKYNSKNISEIDGQEFDLVVCAGAKAAKWLINQDPEADLKALNGLMDHLRTVKAKQFVLISTVDVYNSPVGVDEDTTIDANGEFTNKAYGQHRFMLEEFARQQFPNTLVVRLPGLFGKGLKKNVIFDLLHDNNVDKIHHAGTFQYYNLDNIWKDIQTALDNNLTLVNFTSEPVRTDEIAKEAFGMNFTNEPEGVKAVTYDMKSKFAELFGGKNGYTNTKQKILADVKQFVADEKATL